MKSLDRYWFSLVLAVAALFFGSLTQGLHAAEAQQQADAQPAQQGSGKRTVAEIEAALQAAGAELAGMPVSPEALFDAKKRAEIAPKAIPPIKKIAGLLEELAQVNEKGRSDAIIARYKLLALLSFMGDADTDLLLQKSSESKDPAEAIPAKGARLMADWWKSTDNAAEQGKVLDELHKLVQANEKNDGLAEIVIRMIQLGAASKELRERAESIAVNDLKGEMGRLYAGQIQNLIKLRAMEGKPLVIEGVKVGGGKFSSADWKGKVVLVDFWATWCGPWVADLPKIKKIYADFHDKGLEVVGISCDTRVELLNRFIEINPEMAWTQLFDPAKAGRELAASYGVKEIPTMFLIDRKGILRTVQGRETYQDLIPKLLAEAAE